MARNLRGQADDGAARADQLLPSDSPPLLIDALKGPRGARQVVVTLALLAASSASAQRGPQISVALLPSNSPPSGASVTTAGVLGDARTRELLMNGFPAQLRYRLELWRVGGLFDDLEASTAWDVLVRHDAYAKNFQMVRRGVRETEVLAAFQSLEAVEVALERPFPMALRPLNSNAEYYYNVVLDVRTLDFTDLDELQRWLNGDLEPAVRGKRAPLSALRRGIGTLMSRVLGGDRRHYESRSPNFRT